MASIGQIIWNHLSYQLSRPKRLAILQACIIGLVSGSSAILLGQGVRWLGGGRMHASHLYPAVFVVSTIGLVGGFLAGVVVECAKHKHCDVIVLGASREGMLQQAVHGNIPATISRKTEQNLILVRAASVFMMVVTIAANI